MPTPKNGLDVPRTIDVFQTQALDISRFSLVSPGHTPRALEPAQVAFAVDALYAVTGGRP